ncbi:alpha/beta fold hydrolase [Nesterenkonia alkaliphila]|uniref:Alpha/beta fold hydrolase n=2 Tax=Nesterenkonia alkaliphila TaxID=1463631 RepID=A0A7K1ULP0_9MICC|nr:alpha/beta fold hydrolase [Nesterenkonia alkaliphila]GFZ90103.1 hypothetical protein GCM10011359_19450 [Nesterenkonia alkaliphila]
MLMGKTQSTTPPQPRFLPTSWVGYPRRQAEPQMVTVRFPLGGTRLSTEVAVWKYAAAASSSPPPRLLMIHGFRGDHHGMQLIADALPEFEVWVPDLPGFGATAPVRSSSGERVQQRVEVYAGLVEALAAELRLGRGDTLLGHSFGTIVCAAHLAAHQREWDRLVLSAPISQSIFRGRLLPGAAAVEAYYRLCQALPEPAADAVLRSAAVLEVMNLTLSVGWDPELSAFAKDQHRQFFGSYSDRRTLLESYHASSRHTVADYAQQLRLPTLLAAGAKDNLSTPAGLRALRDALPEARLEVIRGCGHLIHYEKPAQLARAIRRFCAGPAGGETPLGSRPACAGQHA